MRVYKVPVGRAVRRGWLFPTLVLSSYIGSLEKLPTYTGVLPGILDALHASQKVAAPSYPITQWLTENRKH